MTDINLNFMRILRLIFQKIFSKKVKKGLIFYDNQKELINKVEKFKIEKELLLSLMGIETNCRQRR